MGLGHPIQHRVVAHPGHVGGAPLLERAEQTLLGKARIHPDGGHLAERLLDPVEERADELHAALRRVRIARTQLGIDQVAGLGDAGDQRVEDPGVVVAIVFGAGLVAVHLDGQRVDVDGQIADAVAAALRVEPPGRTLQQGTAQDRPVLRGAQHPHQSRQRGLGGEPVGHGRILRQRLAVLVRPRLQRGNPAALGNRQAEHGVVAQRIGIVLIAPALPQEQQRGGHELRQRMRDQLGVAVVDQTLDQPVDEPEPLHHLPQHHRPGLRRQPLGPRLDAQRPVELRPKKSEIPFTHSAPPPLARTSLANPLLARSSEARNG